MRRCFAAFVGALALLAVGSIGVAPAATAAYPPSPSTFSLHLPEGIDTSAVPLNQDFLVTFGTFKPGSLVRIEVFSTVTGLGSTTDEGFGSGRAGTAFVPLATDSCESGSSCSSVADALGTAEANVKFTQPGKQTITATGVDANGKELVVTGTVTVVDPAAATDGESDSLAKTGSDLIRYGLIGLGLVAIGGVLVMAIRRRSVGSTA